MEMILGLLNFILFIALIVGLVKPALVLRWTNKPTRLKVFGYWILSFIIIIFLGLMFVDTEPSIEDEIKKEVAKPSIEDEVISADKLLSEAFTLFGDKKFEESTALINLLKEKHPTSEKIIEAEKLLSDIDKELKEIELAEKRRLSSALKKMRKNIDDMQGVTWYYDKSSPKYVNSRTSLYAYIGKKEDKLPYLRLKIQYAADDWLFIDKFIINVDGVIYEIIEESYGEIKSDSGNGGKIWEWLDRSVNEKELNLIKAISSGKVVKIRFSGSKYHKDVTLSSRDKSALMNVLNAFEALGGKI